VREGGFTISNLSLEDGDILEQAARLLNYCFPGPGGYPDLDSAREEVRESLGPGRLSRVAVRGGQLCGWIGGISQYHGHVWELHPLVVAPSWRGRGLGAALVADLEELVRERGGVTLFVGTDDVDGGTTLSGKDLYPHVLHHARDARVISHPMGFYLKMGFVLVGVLPDANGWGRPDIFMAKRVQGGR
jgi:aminoglycoside 6'-N-acetyltransferase I